MGIVQIAVMGVAGAILAIQFKNGKSEYGIYISIALSVLVFFHILGRVEVIITAIRDISEKIQMKSGYLQALLKCWELHMWRNLLRQSARMRDIRPLPGRLKFSAELLFLH